MALAEEMGSNLKALAVLAFLAIGAVANATTYYVSVAGLGGTPEYEAQFAKWNAQLDDLLKKNGPGVTVETVTGASATRQNLERLFRRLADQIHSDDSFALL